jgi:hypothetical protein
MSYKEPSKILVDIISTEMSLDADRVLIYNNKWNLPNNPDIFVSIASGSSKIISSVTTHDDRGASGFYEVQTLSMREMITIDIFSANSTGRTRKEEIIMALNSTYSQQEQEKYSIKISNLPNSFTDISQVEVSARLSRYNISFPVFSWRNKEKVVDYYETYSYEIETNK